MLRIYVVICQSCSGMADFKKDFLKKMSRPRWSVSLDFDWLPLIKLTCRKRSPQRKIILHHTFALAGGNMCMPCWVCFLGCDGLWLAAALLLCRAIPQVQPVLQSLRRPCSHLPRPDAACSAFSTSRAERGPTPQHYCRDSHTHTKTHTPTQGLLFIQHTS